ncbi:hypothetical protein ACQKPE_26160, partial [Pseudomonas sp. NPDC089554]
FASEQLVQHDAHREHVRAAIDQLAAELAGWICDILADLNNEAVIDAVREKVKAICKKLPVYGN